MSAGRDGCCERAAFLAAAGGSGAHERVIAVLFRNKLRLFESQYQCVCI